MRNQVRLYLAELLYYIKKCFTMKINSLTKIIELVKQHPFIMDELIKLSPKAKKLNNPILQRTIGKRATLADVSKIINIPSNVLIFEEF